MEDNIFIERLLHNIRVAERETFKEIKEGIEIYNSVCDILNGIDREFTIKTINNSIRGVNKDNNDIFEKGTKFENLVYNYLIGYLIRELLGLEQKLRSEIEINAKKLDVE